METKTIALEEMFNEFATANMITEATKFGAAPTGSYDMRITKYEGKERDGRKKAHIQAAISAEGRKRGVVFFDISWVEGRTSSGKLDRESRLWGQLVQALFPDKAATALADMPVGEVLDLATKYQLRVFVTEAFKVPDATKNSGYAYITPRSEQELKDLRSKGYNSQNFVQSISKAPNA